MKKVPLIEFSGNVGADYSSLLPSEALLLMEDVESAHQMHKLHLCKHRLRQLAASRLGHSGFCETLSPFFKSNITAAPKTRLRVPSVFDFYRCVYILISSAAKNVLFYIRRCCDLSRIAPTCQGGKKRLPARKQELSRNFPRFSKQEISRHCWEDVRERHPRGKAAERV